MSERCDVCVVGGGPAGIVFAARMAQLGHEVCLIERRATPRNRAAESLTPGIWPLLDALGARAAVEAGGFAPGRRWAVRWETDRTEWRDHRGEAGLLVDRNRFDAVLLAFARAAGVRVLQPAVMRRYSYGDGHWQMSVASDSREVALSAALLADASGRAGALRGRRQATGARTIALYAGWRGAALPENSRIVAAAHGWLWGLPQAPGLYTTMAFVDAGMVGKNGAEPLLRRLMAECGLMDGAGQADLATPVRAADATPYLDDEPIGAAHIKLGEAALALDPLSSTGVQKSMQSALAAAVAVHTMLAQPQRTETAREFYRDLLRDAAARHQRWAGAYYQTAANRHDTPFWRRRAADEATAAPSLPPAVDAGRVSQGPISQGLRGRPADLMVRLSPAAEIVDTPCVVGEFIALKPALRHPSLARPVAFLGGHELAPLLGAIAGCTTLVDLMRAWPATIPFSDRPVIADWLLRHQVVVPLIP